MSKERYPVMHLQCDWNDTLRIPNSDVWISVKYRTEPSVHGKLLSSSLPSEGKPKISASSEFSIVNQTSNMLTVKHLKSSLTTTFISPMKTFNIHDKGVLSLCAVESAIVVSSFEDDKLIVWDGRTGEELLDLKGHGGPIYKCRFFPSGVVVLTAGVDSSLKVWSAENGANPVTMSGHTMAVTDLAIIDRGRNVLSVSKDGKAKLWDVGESNCLANVLSADSIINCCCILTSRNSHKPTNPREIATDDKLVVVGCEDGTLYCTHIALREVMFFMKLDSAINCVASFEGNVLVGCQDGKVVLISSEDGSIMNEWWESASPVLSLHYLPSNKFIFGSQDGTCMIYSLDHPSIRVQLTGSDCDPIRDISFNGRWVFTGCRDHLIRKYDYNQLNVHFK